MHPSSPHRALLLAVLLVAVFTVLFADILAVSAVADPLPTNSGAILAPINPSTLARPYSHSWFRITSKLLNSSGEPIPDARVDILQQVVGANQMQLIGSTTTQADGSLTATVPAGPSRLIDLAYRASVGEGYAAQTEVRENVSAGLRLHITPTRTTPTGTIQLDGQVLGTIPTGGVVVEVLVYYTGRWQPIRTPRTQPDGYLRVNYQFHQATGQFPFRLRVRYGQVGFPYGEACSQWVEVLA